MRLFGDGKHGQIERIQTFRGPACHTTFSARRNTPLYRLKTPSQQIGMVLSALAEGLDPSAAERVFGYQQATITTWLTRAGGHAHILHERFFCHVHLPHLQLDELRTRLRCASLVLWLWLAIDPRTKILPVLQLGVLATCGIRWPELACENTSSGFLLLADSPEEEYNRKHSIAHFHKGEWTLCKEFSPSSSG
jgi:hypothetical protein